jgi:hypothetical protein
MLVGHDHEAGGAHRVAFGAVIKYFLGR